MSFVYIYIYKVFIKKNPHLKQENQCITFNFICLPGIMSCESEGLLHAWCIFLNYLISKYLFHVFIPHCADFIVTLNYMFVLITQLISLMHVHVHKFLLETLLKKHTIACSFIQETDISAIEKDCLYHRHLTLKKKLTFFLRQILSHSK